MYEALRAGDYDEVIVSTLSRRFSRWLHRDLPGRIRAWASRSPSSRPTAAASTTARRPAFSAPTSVALRQDLLPAERRLVEDGALVLDHGDDPAGGGDWPEDRTVRAPVLRDVLLADAPTRVQVTGARIAEALDLEGMTIARSVVLENCYLAECPNLRSAQLVSLALPGCRSPHGLQAGDCRLRGTLQLGFGFCAESEVVLAGAVVGGAVVASGGRFVNRGDDAVFADGLSVDRGVFLGNGFEAEGTVRLLGARIRGELDCAGGLFRNPDRIAIAADGIRVGRGVFLSHGFHAQGEVRLLGAEIDGQLTCEGGRFDAHDQALQMENMHVHGPVFLRDGFSARGEVTVIAAVIDGRFVLQGEVSRPDALAVDFEAARIDGPLYLQPTKPLDGWVDLSFAQLRSLEDSPAAWQSGYELGGCRYRTLRSVWEADNRHRWLRKDSSVEHRLAWLAGNRAGYVPQVYDQLAEMYGAAGEESHQRDVLIAKQRKRRGQLPWYGRLWNLSLDVLIGFGYRTGRALVPFAAFLAFGWWYFGKAYDDGDIIPRSTAETMSVSPFRPLIYSLDQLVPVVNFGQREHWVATGDAQTLVTVMVIVGWILTTAILAALTGLVRRNQ